MKKTYALLFLAVLFVFQPKADSSPLPAMGSSELVKPQLGLYRSGLGFELNAGGTGWAHVAPPTDNKFVATVYEAPDHATLTVRVDHLDHETTLEKYVQRWVKEYPRYGFTVLGAKPFAQNKQKGYFLDLVNRDTGKEMRQVVFLKEQNAVILTCRDQAKGFEKTLKGCNQIVRTFTWVE